MTEYDLHPKLRPLYWLIQYFYKKFKNLLK